MLEISVNEAATSPMPRQTQRTARREGRFSCHVLQSSLTPRGPDSKIWSRIQNNSDSLLPVGQALC